MLKVIIDGRQELAKAEYKTGIVRADGSFLEKGRYKKVKTIFCHFCKAAYAIRRVFVWRNSPRWACGQCKGTDGCVSCGTLETKVFIRRGNSTHEFCPECFRKSPFVDQCSIYAEEE